MVAYKLLRLRRNGTLAPLFINKTQVIPVGKWMTAELHPTAGYKIRKGWHCTLKPVAPHLSTKGRVWCEVEVKGVELYSRPESQGGTWVLADRMKLLRIMPMKISFNVLPRVGQNSPIPCNFLRGLGPGGRRFINHQQKVSR